MRGGDNAGRGAPRDNQLVKDFDRITERVEIITGARGAATKPLSALRRGELVPLASLTLASAQVTGAPTMDEHNALQADVKAIFDALALISNRLGNATLPAT